MVHNNISIKLFPFKYEIIFYSIRIKLGTFHIQCVRNERKNTLLV